MFLWSYSLTINSPIDIHANYEYPFRAACGEGQLETAKWLYDVGTNLKSSINIHVFDENAFRLCCMGGPRKLVSTYVDTNSSGLQ